MAEKISDAYKLHLNKGKDGVVYGGINLFANKFYGTDEVTKLVKTKKDDRDLSILQINSSYKVDELLKSRIKYYFDVDLEEGSYLGVRASIFSNLATRFDNVSLTNGDYLVVYASNVKLTSFEKKDGTTGYQLDVSAYDFQRIGKSSKESDETVETSTSTNFDFSDDDLPF